MRMPEVIIERYLSMLKDIEPKQEDDPGTGLHHLKWMIAELREDRPWGKQRGWLGFIQYGLIINGYTTVNEERDFTRPIFRKIEYKE